MISPIVHDSEPVLLVGGGKHRKAGFRLAEPLTGKIVAADSGADWLVKHDITPDMVIGDFDSISPLVRESIRPERALLVNEQESTDFEKALSRIEAPLVIGVGFVGGRSDHQLACYHGLLTYAHQRCLLIGPKDIAFLAPPDLRLDLSEGTRVSLFPFAPVRAQSVGLRWNIDQVHFAPDKKIGTSNEAMGPVRICSDGPSLLTILPLSALEGVVAALCERSAGWRAHKTE